MLGVLLLLVFIRTLVYSPGESLTGIRENTLHARGRRAGARRLRLLHHLAAIAGIAGGIWARPMPREH